MNAPRDPQGPNGPNGPQGPNDEKIWEALKGVRFPGMSRDIVSFGFVRAARVDDGRAVVELQLTTQNPAAAEQIKGDVEREDANRAGLRR